MTRMVLRDRAGNEQQVTPFELFFDLVFVFAVTQLSHTLLEDLTPGGTAQTLLLVVWSAWVTTAWVTNWLDPDRLPVRLMLVWVMLAGLFMVPVGLAAPTLALAAAVGLVLVSLAGWETLSRRSHHRRQQRPRR